MFARISFDARVWTATLRLCDPPEVVESSVRDHRRETASLRIFFRSGGWQFYSGGAYIFVKTSQRVVLRTIYGVERSQVKWIRTLRVGDDRNLLLAYFRNFYRGLKGWRVIAPFVQSYDPAGRILKIENFSSVSRHEPFQTKFRILKFVK